MIMITGANGLVGSAIMQKVEAIPISRNVPLTQLDTLINEFTKYKPSVVIHCAAKVGGILGNLNSQGEYFYKNMLMNINVLEACRLCGIKKVISFGSSCAYPESAVQPYSEDQLHLGEPYSAHFAYAYAKRMLSVQSKAYNEQYGVNYLCVIPSNIYGPNDKFDLNNGHVMPSLMLKCFLAKQTDTPFIVWGTGEAYREFIYVKDVATIIDKLIKEDIPSTIHTINLSAGIEYKLETVVKIIADKMGFTGDIIFDNTKPDGQIHKRTDITKLKKLIGNFNFTKLESGIEETLAWLSKNYPNIRK